MQVQIKIECEIPRVPNYLKTANGQVPLSAVTEEALRELGKQWTEALVMRARQQRTNEATQFLNS